MKRVCHKLFICIFIVFFRMIAEVAYCKDSLSQTICKFISPSLSQSILLASIYIMSVRMG